MVNLAFMIVFIAIALGIFGFAIYKAVSLARHPMPKTIEYPKEIKKLFFLTLGISVSTLMLFLFLALWQGYKMTAGDYVQLILGAILFGFTFPAFVLSFIIHYYAKEIDKKSDKLLFITIIAAGVASLFGILLITNGVADHIAYPLVNGINFKHGFVTPLYKLIYEDGKGITPNIAWYALCILSGAILVYVICDHRYYVEYGKHGILESTFFVAFPAGIIGARIGFVIGEWNTKFADRVAAGQWWAPFAIWEGGLTIISGALIGIVVGIAWYLWRNKKYSIWLAVDIIVPCILVAQAIGRWGNCFNCEVHGNLVNAADYWWLPKIVLKNATYSEGVASYGVSGYAPTGMIYLPLFYIEFLTNLAGYFIIRFALGKGLRKYLELGDLASSYIVWYGLTRVILEPLRHPAYNMGDDGYWSWMWSIIFVLVGMLFITGNHIVRYYIRKKMNLPMVASINRPLSCGIGTFFLASGLALTILGSVFMATNVQAKKLIFDKYNNGFILLTIGLSLLLVVVMVYYYILQGKKKTTENEN